MSGRLLAGACRTWASAALLIMALAAADAQAADGTREGEAGSAADFVQTDASAPIPTAGRAIAFAEPENAEPGTPFAFILSGPSASDAVRAALFGAGGPGSLLASGSFFSLTMDEGGAPIMVALLAVPSTAKPGEAALRAFSADGALIAESRLAIPPREFRTDYVPLDPQNTAIRTETDPKKKAEAEALWKLLLSFDPLARWAEGKFVPPLDSKRRTGGFGDRRVYQYSSGKEDLSVHAGLDFGVPSGTQIRAAARGKVVFAGDRIVTGKTVIIEHLPGVYSQYYHLSRVDAVLNAVIEAGKPIGLSGSTGLSTGPHLHWEIRIAGEAVDPDALVARPLLDKESVISRIKGSSAAEQPAGRP